MRADRPKPGPTDPDTLGTLDTRGQPTEWGRKVMKGFVFHGPGQFSWDTVPDPGIKDATDVIVRVAAVTICGTDLHILKGDVPEVRPGTILGHEAVGEVVEAGSDVRTVRPGDRVLVSCITACGRCTYCRKAMYGQCRGGGGWILGHLVDGTQAEYVRVPHADLSVHPLPSTLDAKDAVLLADIFPTGYGALVTHTFPIELTEEAYDVFAEAADTGALKMVLGGTRHEEVAVPAAGRKDVNSHD